MNNALLILVAIIGTSILTTNISINLAMTASKERSALVTRTSNTSNINFNKKINKLLQLYMKTHKDPIHYKQWTIAIIKLQKKKKKKKRPRSSRLLDN